MAKSLLFAAAAVAMVGSSAALALKPAFVADEHTGLDKTPYHFEYDTGVKATGQLGKVATGYGPCDPGVTQYAGYFDINSAQNKHYFYWAFEAKKNPETAPVILWLTGGPGCSSGLAVLAENGPCKVDDHVNVYANPYSWNNVATVIYMDQPAGVGYSYSDNSGLDHNETQVGDDMFAFMQAFYQAFPKFAKNELFVYGESYGGHFAPATAYRLWKGTQEGKGKVPVPLRGLSTGNGLTAPTVQYNWYAPLAYDWCKTVKGKPCVSEATHAKMVSEIPKCISLLKQCNAGNSSADQAACLEAYNYCGYQMDAYMATGLNPYDIRVPCLDGGLCYNFTAATMFFNELNIQQALGVEPSTATSPRKWAICNGTVNGMFNSDWSHDFNQLVPPMMEDGVRVLVYAGDMDFICNWMGNQAWTLELPWSNHTAFVAADPMPWYVDEVPAGRVRSVSSTKNNLQFSFVQVHGAGHMVPMNQPKRALNMVMHFLGDTSFETGFMFD